MKLFTAIGTAFRLGTPSTPESGGTHVIESLKDGGHGWDVDYEHSGDVRGVTVMLEQRTNQVVNAAMRVCLTDSERLRYRSISPSLTDVESEEVFGDIEVRNATIKELSLVENPAQMVGDVYWFGFDIADKGDGFPWKDLDGRDVPVWVRQSLEKAHKEAVVQNRSRPKTLSIQGRGRYGKDGWRTVVDDMGSYRQHRDGRTHEIRTKWLPSHSKLKRPLSVTQEHNEMVRTCRREALIRDKYRCVYCRGAGTLTEQVKPGIDLPANYVTVCNQCKLLNEQDIWEEKNPAALAELERIGA